MMIDHGAAVVRGSTQALVVVDLPFGTYEESPEQAFHSAVQVLRKTGASAVKLEGGEKIAITVAFLASRGIIPVMGHIGLTPQAVHTLGGYGVRGKESEEQSRILNDAHAIARAGVFAIVVEAVVETLAIAITEVVSCPIIGIGASARCDGQVLVVDDMLGMFSQTARFVTKFADLSSVIDHGVATYAGSVRRRDFPGSENLYNNRVE